MTTRPRRFLLYAITALVPALGLLTATVGGASARSTKSRASAASYVYKRQVLAREAITKLSIGHHPLNSRVPVSSPRKINGLTQVQSTNWGGYADTGTSYSAVSAKWTEPSATCSSRTTQLAAFWVGIDGYSSSSVEQDGTIIECYLGTAYQYTWWEMYPTNAIQVVGQTAASGDAITATVTRSGTSYKLTVTDATHTADSFTTTQTCSSCAITSAEWIAEAPSGSSGIYPLADFHSWTASSATVTEGTTSGVISSFTDDELTMINSSGATKALPGALNGSGNGFSVTWERAS